MLVVVADDVKLGSEPVADVHFGPVLVVVAADDVEFGPELDEQVVFGPELIVVVAVDAELGPEVLSFVFVFEHDRLIFCS